MSFYLIGLLQMYIIKLLQVSSYLCWWVGGFVSLLTVLINRNTENVLGFVWIVWICKRFVVYKLDKQLVQVFSLTLFCFSLFLMTR